MTQTLSAAEAALRDAAREYHRNPGRGKISVTPTKPLSNQRDLSLAYSPGVAYPCLDIQADPSKAFDYTSRGNLVGVITNGTAVLGLGDIGPLAGKPVMEGKAVLFKKFSGIDVFESRSTRKTLKSWSRSLPAWSRLWVVSTSKTSRRPSAFILSRNSPSA